MEEILSGAQLARPANLLRRLLAFLIDLLLLVGLGMAVGEAFPHQLSKMGPNAAFLGLGLAVLYFGLFESGSAGGASVGKRIMKLKVMKFEGSPIGPVHALLRSIPIFLSLPLFWSISWQLRASGLPSLLLPSFAVAWWGITLFFAFRPGRLLPADRMTGSMVAVRNVSEGEEPPRLSWVDVAFMVLLITSLAGGAFSLHARQALRDKAQESTLESLVRSLPNVRWVHVEILRDRKEVGEVGGKDPQRAVRLEAWLDHEPPAKMELEDLLTVMERMAFGVLGSSMHRTQVRLVYGFDLGVWRRFKMAVSLDNGRGWRLRFSPHTPVVEAIKEASDAMANVGREPSLQELLCRREFEKLTRILEGMQNEQKADDRREAPVFSAYQSFEVGLGHREFEALLLAWDKASPLSYAPKLASAHYYLDQAWAWRGHGYSHTVSEKQTWLMNFFLERARSAANKALLVDRALPQAFRVLIRSYGTSGGNDAIPTEVLERAFAQCPGSLSLRLTYMNFLRPRWRGSYEAIDGFAKSSQEAGKGNPSFRALSGFSSADKANLLLNDDRYGEALSGFDEALTHGDLFSYLEERAATLRHLKRYDDALADLERAEKVLNVPWRAALERARVFKAKADWVRCAEALEAGRKYVPYDPDAHRWGEASIFPILKEGWTKVNQRDFDGAFASFKLAHRICPTSWELHYQMGNAYRLLGNHELAERELRKCLAFNPAHRESLQGLTWYMASRKDFQGVVDVCNRLIDVEPTRAHLYFERGRARYHLGQAQEAVSDARLGCDLGSKEACEKLEWFRARGLT